MERRIETRRKDFKKVADDPRRKREDMAVQIRKESRDAQLSKRRQQAAMRTEMEGDVVELHRPSVDLNMRQLVEEISSNDPVKQFNATREFRRVLSIEKNPPIQRVIETGVVPRFVEFLRDDSQVELQFESAWVLTNIASGNQDQTRVVIEANAVPLFVHLLRSPKEDVREQAVWALGNIAGDSPQCRDLVLSFECLTPLLELLGTERNEPISLVRNATWALSNLCRGKPEPEFQRVKKALDVLRSLIYHSDADVLTDACWALSYLSDGPPDHIDAVIHSGVCRRLVELLLHPTHTVQTPALRAVGNIVTGNDQQTQVIISVKALNNLLTLLTSPRKGIKKEACWTISNITAGNREQIQEVISAGLIAPLVQLLTDAEFDIKKEAAWALSNAASGGTLQQVEFLVGCGSVKPLCDLLTVNDSKIVTVALEALENILKMGQRLGEQQGLTSNPYVDLVEQADAFNKLEQLQFSYQGTNLNRLVVRILTTYFPLDEEMDREVEVGETSLDTNLPQGGFRLA